MELVAPASIVRVTGHFDDAAAADCVVAPGDPDPEPISDVLAELFCSQQFVVDSYEILGVDEDSRSAEPRRNTRSRPARAASWRLRPGFRLSVQPRADDITRVCCCRANREFVEVDEPAPPTGPLGQLRSWGTPTCQPLCR